MPLYVFKPLWVGLQIADNTQHLFFCFMFRSIQPSVMLQEENVQGKLNHRRLLVQLKYKHVIKTIKGTHLSCNRLNHKTLATFQRRILYILTHEFPTKLLCWAFFVSPLPVISFAWEETVTCENKHRRHRDRDVLTSSRYFQLTRNC